jgi:hypothetical protein
MPVKLRFPSLSGNTQFHKNERLYLLFNRRIIVQRGLLKRVFNEIN